MPSGVTRNRSANQTSPVLPFTHAARMLPLASTAITGGSSGCSLAVTIR